MVSLARSGTDGQAKFRARLRKDSSKMQPQANSCHAFAASTMLATLGELFSRSSLATRSLTTGKPINLRSKACARDPSSQLYPRQPKSEGESRATYGAAELTNPAFEPPRLPVVPVHLGGQQLCKVLEHVDQSRRLLVLRLLQIRLGRGELWVLGASHVTDCHICRARQLSGSQSRDHARPTHLLRHRRRLLRPPCCPPRLRPVLPRDRDPRPSFLRRRRSSAST